MVKPTNVEITCYIPTKTKAGVEIDKSKIEGMINKIWPKYSGATRLKGKGYYQPKTGKGEERATCYVLTIITEYPRSIKHIDGELSTLKKTIKKALKQEEVLITCHETRVA